MDPVSKPASVLVHDGMVIMETDDGVQATWTPDAAIETGKRLLAAGAEAAAARQNGEVSDLTAR